jgi:hypothetical protein
MTAHSKITIGRTLAGMALGLLALALACGQTALASPAHAAHAKQKKKPSRQVLVHCASVTITCKPDPHNQGPAGPTGSTGQSGPTGTTGHGVADRIRWTGEVLSSDGATSATVPLASPSFGQEAGEDERLLGLATVTAPRGECESGKPHEGELEGLVTLDGAPFGIITEGSSYEPGSKLTLPILWTGSSLEEELVTVVGVLPVVSSPQTNTLAIALHDDCNASSTTHFVLSSVAIDVLRSN